MTRISNALNVLKHQEYIFTAAQFLFIMLLALGILLSSHLYSNALSLLVGLAPFACYCFLSSYFFKNFALLPLITALVVYQALFTPSWQLCLSVVLLTHIFSALIAAQSCRYLLKQPSKTLCVRDAIIVLVISNMIQALLGAFIGVSLMMVLQANDNQLGFDSYLQWAFSIIAMNILSLPVVMFFKKQHQSKSPPSSVLTSYILTFGLLSIVALGVAFDSTGSIYAYSLFLTGLPLCSWLALQAHTRHTVVCLTGFTWLGIILASMSFFHDPHFNFLLVSLYFAAVMFTGLLLHAVNVERGVAYNSSKAQMQLLETAVESRTEALREKIRESEALAAKLRNLSLTDYLTGIANRRAFVEYVSDDRIKRNAQIHKQSYLLLIDLDYFKSINDRFGHEVGDVCLLNFAQLLRNTAKNYAQGFAARIGGEEFAMFICCDSDQEALAIANKLRLATSSLRIDDNDAIELSISVGLTSLCHAEKSLDSGLVRADKALYQAKHSGRNCVKCAYKNTALSV